MSSSIFSFRTIAVAAALVGLIEGVCALTLRPGFLARTNVGFLDRFHNSVIFGKLADFEQSSPDVIQVGDSSGFHGVRPEVVMSYLGGLKYVNLSCCANTGYRGYYGIADFMLRRNPGIKAVVLYVSLNNLPRKDLIRGDHQMGESIQNSLTTPFAHVAPPTIALRQKIADEMRTNRGSRTETAFIADMQRSTQRHYGWWAEHDRRLAGGKRAEYWRRICGETGVAFRNDDDVFYGDDLVHGRQSYMRTELQRFASLAAGHGAKLVALFHPFSCRGLEGSLLPARRDDIRAVLKQHDNVVALPEQMLELWPTGKFVSADHLHVGYDEENSRRVGRLLTQALGVRRGGAPATADAAATAANALGAARSATPPWRSEGAAVGPGNAQDGTAGFRRLIESSGPGFHRMEATLTGLTPGATTVLSFQAKPFGARGILVELQTDRQDGGGFCDLVGGTAQRKGDMLDVGLDVQPNGPSRCWVAMDAKASTATLRLSLLDEHLEPSYGGDGRSGAAIGDIELREAMHFLQGEESPW
jgi:hypothetical protein